MQDQRIHPRYPLHWRVALRTNDNQLYYGDTLDVSMGGTSVLVEQNMPSGTLVSLFLQIPPKRTGEQAAVIETRAKILYTAFSAPHDRWRLGIQFLDFNGDPRRRMEHELSRYA